MDGWENGGKAKPHTHTLDTTIHCLSKERPRYFFVQPTLLLAGSAPEA